MNKQSFRLWRNYFATLLASKPPADLFKDVTAYCMFIGYSRSGHSLIGALLNAHPETVIAHELHSLFYIARGVSRRHLYSLILQQDHWFTSERGCKAMEFNYGVPNQWQGRFRTLKVVGHKKGSASTMRLRRSPQLLARLRKTVQVPVKMPHIVRNPFDVIATMSRRRKEPLEVSARYFFSMAETNARLLAEHSSDILTQRQEDFITAPREQLTKLVEFVGLQADDQYLSDCASILYSSPSKSRLKAEWPKELKADVQSRLDQFPFLRGYTFDS